MQATKSRALRVASLAATVIATLATPARADIDLLVFRAGERARAADVNGNFNTLKLAIEAAERRNLELSNRIVDLEAALANLRALDSVLTVEQRNGVPTVRLTGVNLQVVNGLNRTESVNGAGNVIIGYDEPNTFTTGNICSRATANNGALVIDDAGCLAAGGVLATHHKSGSHNLVLGEQNSWSSFAGIISGRINFVNEAHASVIGGVDNRSSGRQSVIVGGQGHTASANSAVVAGGIGGKATGRLSTIVGGVGHTASGENSTVAGGERNVASSRNATAVGGLVNNAAGELSTTAGGRNNSARGLRSSIFGGDTRSADAQGETIP
jgi:hypothetical protein